jgi:signal transduction histidine kinase
MTSTALVAIAFIATALSILAAEPGARNPQGCAQLAQQLLLPAALASAVVLFIASRIRPTTSSVWLASALTIIGLQGLPMLATTTNDSTLFEQGALSTAIVIGLTLLFVVKLANSKHVRVAPMPLGIGIGLLLIVLRGVWHYIPFPTIESAYAATIGGVALLLIGFVLGLLIRRVSALPLGNTRLSLAVVLWACAAAIRAFGLTGSPVWSAAAVLGALAACTLTVSTALDLLWYAMREEQADIHHLQQQLLNLRNRAREGVEQLHEVKGTIAGIASATDLIRHEHRLSMQHRERLEEMLARETARLQRLVHADTEPGSRRPIDLDDVIGPIVTAHRVQGQPVVWAPPRVPVYGDADELAEVVNILLQNAASHAPGALVRVFTREHDGDLQLVVADSGPGVPPELRDRIFEWGYHQAESAGQGVGLASARRLLAKRGCYLRLEPHHPCGAAFLVELKRAERESRQGVDTVLTS